MRLSIKRFAWILLFAVTAAAAVANAAGDADQGAVLATTCSGCHGIPDYRNGYPSYSVPKLGGQQEEYIVAGLQGYQAENRAHPTMRAQAARLTEQDMRNVAAWVASQGSLEDGATASGAQITRGGQKAAVCAACHGGNGISSTPNWPSLAGQHEDYLREALNQYRTGQRNDPVMAGQVVNLTDEDIADIAAYYAAQPGLFTTD